MPRPRKRAPKQRLSYGIGHIEQLVGVRGILKVGPEFEGFGLHPDPADMRVAWDLPQVREQVYALQQWRNEEGGPLRLRPRGWWLFESPQPRDQSMTEEQQLRALDLLTEQDERFIMALDKARGTTRPTGELEDE